MLVAFLMTYSGSCLSHFVNSSKMKCEKQVRSLAYLMNCWGATRSQVQDLGCDVSER